MDAQEAGSAAELGASARHSLSRPVAVPDPEPAGSEHAPGAWFAVVLRGYDRAQVDARLAELDRRIRDETVRAEKAEAALGTARSQVRRLQETPAADGEERGFGVRVERVLQAAEREASDLREKAAAEASELLERARQDAEQQHRRTEQALLGRAATLDREFTARGAALDAREREVDEMVEAARREAVAIRGEAERVAAEERADAERRAADLLRQAEQTAREERAGSIRDIERLSALRDEVRAELSRLQEALRAELEREPVATALDDQLFGPSGRDVPTTDGRELLDDDADGELRTGKLRIASARDEPEDNPNERTSIGTIPPFTAASIGVLPFRDRSAAPSKVRPFAFGPDAVERGAADEPADGGSEARTRDDDPARDSSPTRSTSSSGGPR